MNQTDDKCHNLITHNDIANMINELHSLRAELALTCEERDAARMAADQLKAMVERRWISVKDRLPETGNEERTGTVYYVMGNTKDGWVGPVKRKYGIVQYPFAETEEDERWHWESYDGVCWTNSKIARWQPLPPAPEASDEN